MLGQRRSAYLEECNTFVASSDIEKSAQRVVYTLFIATSRRHDIIELCTACRSTVVGLQG